MKQLLLTILLLFASLSAQARDTYNFNSDWELGGKKVTLPHAWNEDESYERLIDHLSDSVVWYRKHFRLPKMQKGSKVFVEFEGARQMAEVYLNGQRLGMSENGVMAFGFELTPYLKKGDNYIEVKTDNDWNYKEQATGSKFQWNNKNFNVNYGGLCKNVYLHIMPAVYQTLPLYSTLGTTGTYIYAQDIDVNGRKATIHAEAEVSNSSKKPLTTALEVLVLDADGKQVAQFKGAKVTIPANTAHFKIQAAQSVGNLHFWSWGYGYLYEVKTIVAGDTVTTKTGFRKTAFKDGMIYLNDRVIQVHGYAQRTSNEWPGVGMSVPAWLSDYSNDLVVQSGGNMMRWMHVAPWRQDVESCDRVGLLQAMPAGDAEADVSDRRWEQRVELMRDAIIYFRNNPSIIFYECGNHGITREHMVEMKKIRDEFDFFGGRAIGSREMLDIDEAEYGGEMLYVNKSKTKPLWMMEYCRDESLRKYWNSWSYPFHKQGAGPLYRNAPAPAYNRNADDFVEELVRRWYDYYTERPGTATRVNSGGVKIIFSDTQTHCRGEENYRRSGVTDAMRIPKDAFFAHQVMWDGWVDDIAPRTYIVGHWNYQKGDTIPRIYVVSNGKNVSLRINGKDSGITPKHEYRYLYTFLNVPYEAGELKAIADNSEYSLQTVGEPYELKLTKIENPQGWKADGADVVLVQYEVVDRQGRRCPLDNRNVRFELEGPAEWRGGISTPTGEYKAVTQDRDSYFRGEGNPNHVLETTLPVEAGVNRVMLRSTTNAGKVVLKAYAEGLKVASIAFDTQAFATQNGLTKSLPSEGLTSRYSKGETPRTPSFVPSGVDIPILSATAGSNADKVSAAFDDNERSIWVSRDKSLDDAWIEFEIEPTEVKELQMKMGDFRRKSYPIEIYADGSLIWRGYTPKSLSYIHIPVGRKTQKIKVQLVGAVRDGDMFDNMGELEAKNDDKIARGNGILRIMEAQIIKNL